MVNSKIFTAWCMSMLTVSLYAISSVETQASRGILVGISSIPLVLAHKDRTADSIRDNDLKDAAGKLHADTLCLLEKLKPTSIITKKHLNKNKELVSSLYARMLFVEDYLCDALSEKKMNQHYPLSLTERMRITGNIRSFYAGMRSIIFSDPKALTRENISVLRDCQDAWSHATTARSPHNHLSEKRLIIEAASTFYTDMLSTILSDPTAQNSEKISMLRDSQKVLLDVIKKWSPNNHLVYMRNALQQILDIHTKAYLAAVEQERGKGIA